MPAKPQYDKAPEREPSYSEAPLEIPQTNSSTAIPHYRYCDLSQSGTEVIIEHQGQTYRLRMTRNGKLIMNK